ncbi:calsequestrin-1-like [Poecile atricapillus]|uniref:calsequestrin-1-like n=1 Tax=Poecile atricapillus TaxID=48891 RepID=UPI00273880D0|nr:calsequestrin-1-like [Poecile atricapillus]
MSPLWPCRWLLALLALSPGVSGGPGGAAELRRRPGDTGPRPEELEALEALGTPVQVVAAGQELRAFGDIEEEPKVIGYFEGRDSEPFQAFSATAQRFHPSLLFFATFDPQAAQELRLGLNQLHLFEPFLEQPRSFRGDPGDPHGIEAFVESSKRATLQKLKAQSTSRNWEDLWDGTHIVAFAEGDDPDGFEFLEILKEVARDKRDNPEFRILWIDPDDFPMLVPSWEDTFDLDLSRPQLGVVNGTDHASSVWLDMEDEEDLPGPEEVLEWLEEVLEGDTGDRDGDDDEEDDDDDDDEDDDDEDDDDDDDDDDNDGDKVDDDDDDADS